MKRRGVLFGAAVGGAIAASAWRGRGEASATDADVPLAGPLPHLGVLPRLHDGAALWTPASMRGQVWALNVWASWCAPCRAEHPLWVDAVRATGLPLVGLNTRDDPHAAREWLLQLGDPYHAVATDHDGRAAASLGLTGVPASFLVDAQGVVRLRHIGPLTAEVWAGDLLPLWRGFRA